MDDTKSSLCSGCGTPTHCRYEGIPLCKACYGDALALAKRLLADRDAEIARLKAELAAALAANPTAPTTAVEVPRPATATEIRTYMDRLADQPRAGGYVPPSAPLAPPAEDPRIAALCRVVEHLADIAWSGWLGSNPAFPSESINDDLLTITGHR